MDVLPQLIADYKSNSVKLNDITNQQNTNTDRMSRFFEKIWQGFSLTKLVVVPNNDWDKFQYKGFKVKGNSVRVIGHAPYCALDDRSVTVPLSVIDKGPAEVFGFLVNKVKDDVIAAAERQKREDDEDAAKRQSGENHFFLETLFNDIFGGTENPPENPPMFVFQFPPN